MHFHLNNKDLVSVKILYFMNRVNTTRQLPKRTRNAPERFSELSFIPGGNNKQTKGRRPIDPYDRAYSGW